MAWTVEKRVRTSPKRGCSGLLVCSLSASERIAVLPWITSRVDSWIERLFVSMSRYSEDKRLVFMQTDLKNTGSTMSAMYLETPRKCLWSALL